MNSTVKFCAFCGKVATENHHMFPQTKRHLKVYGRKLINAPFNLKPACNECNGSHRNVELWDEMEFRRRARALEYPLPAGTKSFQAKVRRGAFQEETA